MTNKKSLIKAQQSVVRAAVGWVNFESDGLVGSMKKEVLVNTRLVNAVMRLQKLRKQL